MVATSRRVAFVESTWSAMIAWVAIWCVPVLPLVITYWARQHRQSPGWRHGRAASAITVVMYVTYVPLAWLLLIRPASESASAASGAYLLIPIVAAVGVIATFGGLIAVTQEVKRANDGRFRWPPWPRVS